MDNEQHGDCVRTLLSALEHDLAPGGGLVAYLIPSTRQIINCVDAALRRHPGPVVVGSSIARTTSPAKLLSSLRTSSDYRPLVIVFSDQLVGPDVATIPVEVEGQKQYLSGLEAVLQARYGYTLRALLHDRLETVRVQETVERTVELLLAYFTACESLGDTWLARDHQASRHHHNRVRESRLRTRYFQSAIFHRYADRALDAAAREALLRVEEITQRLTERSR